MAESTETTQEQNSEFTVIGKLWVAGDRRILHEVQIRDYSTDASRVVFVVGFNGELGTDPINWYMEIDSPSHSTGVLHNLLASSALNKIDLRFLNEHGYIDQATWSSL